MPRNERSVIRFGVGSPEGPRGRVWRLWARRNDVYIAARDFGEHYKASLHQRGSWRDGFTKGSATRYWRRHPEFAPGFTLVFRIVVPWSELAPEPPLADNGEPVEWVPAPPAGAMTAFAVLYSAPGVPLAGDWPGQLSMGTRLVGRVALANGETVWVVVREEPLDARMQAEVDKVKAAGCEALRLMTAAKGSPVTPSRMLVSGHADEGTTCYLDVAPPTLELEGVPAPRARSSHRRGDTSGDDSGLAAERVKLRL